MSHTTVEGEGGCPVLIGCVNETVTRGAQKYGKFDVIYGWSLIVLVLALALSLLPLLLAFLLFLLLLLLFDLGLLVVINWIVGALVDRHQLLREEGILGDPGGGVEYLIGRNRGVAPVVRMRKQYIRSRQGVQGWAKKNGPQVARILGKLRQMW